MYFYLIYSVTISSKLQIMSYVNYKTFEKCVYLKSYFGFVVNFMIKYPKLSSKICSFCPFSDCYRNFMKSFSFFQMVWELTLSSTVTFSLYISQDLPLIQHFEPLECIIRRLIKWSLDNNSHYSHSSHTQEFRFDAKRCEFLFSNWSLLPNMDVIGKQSNLVKIPFHTWYEIS